MNDDRRPPIRRRLRRLSGLLGLATVAGVSTAAAIIAGLDFPKGSFLPSTFQLVTLVAASLLTAVLVVFQQRRDQPSPAAPRLGPAVAGAGALPSQVIDQLPPRVADFVNRVQALEHIRRVFSRRFEAGSPGAMVISGPGGVGKTTLAVQAAGELAGTMGDGCLYVDLRGADGGSVEPREVLGGFLRDLGLSDSEIPEGLSERARLYRALLSRRRLVVVLDNAYNEAQVRPLLPNVATFVLITSRSSLAGLESVSHLELGVFDDSTAAEFLSSLAAQSGGPAPARDADQATARIAELCGNLPLALRIAGAKLATVPHLTAATFAGRLQDEQRRLHELRAGDLDVRSNLMLSYEELTAAEKRAFCLIGLIQTPDWPMWALIGLTGEDLVTVERIVERLVEAHLIEPLRQGEGGSARFRTHDLVRLFARERLVAAVSAEESAAAELSYLELLSCSAQHAAATMGFGELNCVVAWRWQGLDVEMDLPYPLGDALDWFAAEMPAIVLAAESAHARGHDRVVCELVTAIADFLELHDLWPEWERTHLVGLRSARRAGDAFMEALVMRNLSVLRWYQKDLAPSTDLVRRSARAFHELGDVFSEALTLRLLGSSYYEQGRREEARELWLVSLDMMRSLGDAHGEASVRRELGFYNLAQGEQRAAVEDFAFCLEVFREIEDRWCEAITLQGLGQADRELGESAKSIDELRTALAIYRDLKALGLQAEVLESLARSCLDASLLRDARTACENSRDMWLLLGDQAAVRRTRTLLEEIREASRRRRFGRRVMAGLAGRLRSGDGPGAP